MELVSEAIAFAVKAHDGMRRKKSNAPYILHPMEAAVIVGTMTDDQNPIAAAALHDVVEDAGISLKFINTSFWIFILLVFFLLFLANSFCISIYL